MSEPQGTPRVESNLRGTDIRVTHPFAEFARTLERETIRQRAAIKACIAICGNVDHGRGHGENASKMRGAMLNAIRDLLAGAQREGGE